MHINIKINETLYPATVQTICGDFAFGRRESKAITLRMDNATAATLFVDGAKWGIAHFDVPDPETGGTQEYVEDMSDYCLAGPITDNRDGTVTVKMGKRTKIEELEAENAALLYELLTGEVLV